MKTHLLTAAIALVSLPALGDSIGPKVPGGWLPEAIELASDPEAETTPFDRGYDFGKQNASTLAEAWDSHDEALRAEMGMDLGEAAEKTAELSAEELSSAALQELDGVAEGLASAGEAFASGQIVGWSALMDQSLYWAPRISDSTQPEDMRQIGVGGTLYSVHSARLSHNITAPEPDVLRFQVNHGDVWEDDWSRYERAEIAGPVYPADETLIVSYDLMIEPGEPSKSEWVVLSQFHADDLDTPPPFAIEFSNEQMVVRIRWRRDGEIGQIRLHRDKENLERGRYYRMHIRLRFADSEEEDGWIKVWRDGEVIADYKGPLGYGYGAYWKMGIYRTQAPETLAVNVRNLFVASEYGLIAGPDGPRIGGE